MIQQPPDPTDFLQIMDSPLLWSKQYLHAPGKPDRPFVPNFTQEQVLGSRYRLNVMRIHRRGGKSVSMVILALYYCMTMKNAEILLIAPRHAQVEVFRDTFFQFINDHPFIKESVVRRTKKPFHCEFSNGSIIHGFTTGSASKGKGDNIRGQGADIILIDEMAMLADEDFTALGTILDGDEYREFPPLVYAASTPRGAFGMFYEWCTDPQYGFHEIKVALTDNPKYPPARCEEIRVRKTKREWEQECLVEFLETGFSVFPPSLVKAARRGDPYSITNMPRPEVEIDGQKPVKRVWRAMGVDWDKYNLDGSGPNISVVEIDERPYDVRLTSEENKTRNGELRVIYREGIPQGETCLGDTVKRIIELNWEMEPDVISIDPGNGEFQIEELKNYGKQNPTSKLAKKVWRTPFGGSIVVVDPIDHTPVKKPFKEAMVNILSKFLEDRILSYSETDKEFHDQLIKYRVVSQSNSRTTYSKVDEHIIDSVGLACAALYHIHKSPFRRIITNQSVMLPSPEVMAAASMTEQQLNSFKLRHPSTAPILKVTSDRDKNSRTAFFNNGVELTLEPKKQQFLYGINHHTLSSRSTTPPFTRKRF